MTEPGGLALDGTVLARMREMLPAVAAQTVTAITDDVPGYAGALTGQMGRTISAAVQTALGAFLEVAAQERGADPSTPLQPALDGAYALGRGEARSGRSMEALLAAYRVGARVSWREWSTAAVAAGLPATVVAQFAELVFAYIDRLSAASAAGHSDELETTGRVRQRYLDRLAQLLLAGADGEALETAAERADWAPPAELTAVLLPAAAARGPVALLDPRTLVLSGDDAGVTADEPTTVLLAPGARPPLLRVLEGRRAVVGPTRPWTQVGVSFARAVRALPLAGEGGLDTDASLAELVLSADPEALADLRARVLAPLADVREGTAERLAETLRSWLLHHGRREEVAAELHVHPQTVRYRMTQLRELYGEALTDPRTVLELTVALAVAR